MLITVITSTWARKLAMADEKGWKRERCVRMWITRNRSRLTERQYYIRYFSSCHEDYVTWFVKKTLLKLEAFVRLSFWICFCPFLEKNEGFWINGWLKNEVFTVIFRLINLSFYETLLCMEIITCVIRTVFAYRFKDKLSELLQISFDTIWNYKSFISIYIAWIL